MLTEIGDSVLLLVAYSNFTFLFTF